MHLNTQTHTSTYLSERVVTGGAPLPAAVVARVANRHGVVHEHARDEADRAVSWLHVVARVAQATVDLVDVCFILPHRHKHSGVKEPKEENKNR